MDRPLLTPLGAGDEPELERFLLAHADSSVFLRGNSAAAGIVDRGEPLQGTYVAARQAGDLVAVCAHFWNGWVVVQGRVDAIADTVRAAVARSGRAIKGINGPNAQVVAARHALGLDGRRAQLDSREDLFALALPALRVPEPLADGRWQVRHPIEDDRDELGGWGYDYQVETLGRESTEAGRQESIRGFHPSTSQGVLIVDGARVAVSGFNAELSDTVQVGGVFTPPALRGRGYARAVVAGSLLAARARGVTRSVLFTGHDNVAARTAYVALGYERVGDYGIVLFAD